MAMVMSRSAILQDIVSSARMHHHSTTLSEPCPSHTQSQTNADIPPLALSEHTEILRRKMIHHGVPSQVCTATMAKAAEVMAVYQASYASSCRHLMTTAHSFGTSPISSIQSLRRTMEHLYEHKDVMEFFSTAVKSKSLFGSQPAELEPRERKPFNNQFTPYLEAYLEQNAFPSIADQKALAEQGNMDHHQIVTWFQNRRSRARKYGKEAALKRLSPGQLVNVDLIEETIRSLDQSPGNYDTPNEEINSRQSAPREPHLDLDQLAHSSKETIHKGYKTQPLQQCIANTDAFRLPIARLQSTSQSTPRAVEADNLAELFGGFNIRLDATSMPKTTTSKSKANSNRTTKVTPKMKPLKATLRSCFSAAITLTCPRSHPALIRKKAARSGQHSTIGKSTILEQERVPVMPYTPPSVLPSWNLPAQGPIVKCKKPTVPSHGGKMRPGSPYPKQTISRMSSASSLASMASDDSQSSSRSSSSTFSSITSESPEVFTPVQSPSPDNAELIDDTRFGDDIFGDYFLHSNPIPDNFFFDINVEQPFDYDVSLSIAEFDKSTSLSIAEFETTTLPSFDFFES